MRKNRKQNVRLDVKALARFLCINDGCTDYMFSRYVTKL